MQSRVQVYRFRRMGACVERARENLCEILKEVENDILLDCIILYILVMVSK